MTFFDKVSAKGNYLDPSVVTDVYYALIRLILEELRTKGSIEMPEFGKFRVHEHKARRSTNVNTGEVIMLDAINIVKFEPCKKLKYYIKNKK